MKRILLILVLSLVLILSLAACGGTDVVGETSADSFGKLLEAMPEQIEAGENDLGWVLNAPDGSASFFWGKDYSGKGSYDAFIETDIQPFLEAGLKGEMLPPGTVSGDKIVVGIDLGDDKIVKDKETDPLDSYRQILDSNRDAIQYHGELDHYGINIGNGNVFEWAKNMGTNDKDLVFVLDPGVFIEAGVDPEKVDGWVFGKVKVDGKDGKPVEVEKFLKPFDIL